MARTVGELIRLGTWTSCGELVDVDLILSTSRTDFPPLSRPW